jgi:hypothetical protein
MFLSKQQSPFAAFAAAGNGIFQIASGHALQTFLGNLPDKAFIYR